MADRDSPGRFEGSGLSDTATGQLGTQPALDVGRASSNRTSIARADTHRQTTSWRLDAVTVTQANKAVVRRFYKELWNERRQSVAEGIIADAFHFRGSLSAQHSRGVMSSSGYAAGVASTPLVS